MTLPFNITNPGFVLGSQLTSQEASLVTSLTALSPSDGDIFVYRVGSGDWVLEAKPAGGSNPAWGDITGTIASQTDLQSALDDKQDILAEGEFVDGDKTKLDGAEMTSNKNTANGYAGLDASSKINPSQLPALAISETFVVASEVAQLALTVQEGDIAVRTDENKSYIALNDTNATMSDWQELLTPTDAVSSVFGRSGTVTAQSGDYNTSQVTVSTDKNYVTDAEKVVIGNTSGTNTGDQDLSGLQLKAVVVSGSLTAVLDSYYVNVANATYTDPSPSEGKGFIVFVRNGAATVGGTGYGTAGTIVHRIFHSGSWANYVYRVTGASGGDAWGDAVDADIVPDADGTRDLGSSSNRFAETHTDKIYSSVWQSVFGGPSELNILSTTGAILTAFLSDTDASSDSPVNYPLIGASTTGNPIVVEAQGTDTDVSINIEPKGTGEAQVNGERILTEADSIPTVVYSDTEPSSPNDGDEWIDASVSLDPPVRSTNIANIVALTQAEYDALGSYDSTTLYYITD
jgi:hypothetical protein